MTMQPSHHDPTPSIAVLRQKGKVTKHNEVKEQEFHHADKPSIYALDKSKRVEIGRNFWEQKENWQSMNSVDWRELKSAKDFELGIGQTFYRHGTLSTWTDDQIATLQKQMETTIALTGDEKEDNNDNNNGKNNGDKDDTGGGGGLTQANLDRLDKPRHRESKENASVATVVINNDVSISLSADAANQLSSQLSANSLSGYSNPYSPRSGNGYEEDDEESFVDNIGGGDSSNNKSKKGKRKKNRNKGGNGQPTHGPTGTDLALLDIANEIERQKQEQATSSPNYTNDDGKADDFDPKSMKSHRRTRTEALRLKLTDMERRLKHVTEDLNTTAIERDQKNSSLHEAEVKLIQAKRDAEQKEKLKNELSALGGALKSAQSELAEAEAQISRKDQENANLQRELTICKQLNAELAGKNDDGSGLTPDDLINTRIADAKRFAFMLTAMQEQLEFERETFVNTINQLENQLDHKDVQLTTLYQLYTKLVQQTEKKGWFSRWLDSGKDNKDNNNNKDDKLIITTTKPQGQQNNGKKSADV